MRVLSSALAMLADDQTFGEHIQNNSQMWDKSVYIHNAKIYKMLANPKRLELLNILNVEKEVASTELARRLNLKKANVSQHLYFLKKYKLVKTRKNGQNVYYSLTDPRIVEPCKIFKELLLK